MQQGGAPWQARLREWQGTAVSLAKQQVPAVYAWLGSQFDAVVARQNLTGVTAKCKISPPLLGLSWTFALRLNKA